MSTDSEDLDEDELLQMALKEQAERDVNYQKPPSKSSKPVANYVQPPPNKGSPASGSKNPNPRQRNHTKSIDEDDDSEVEMLSISSGDEESSRASTYGGGGGGGAGAKGRSRTKASKDDGDSLWAGGEPDSWKRVDESEVGFSFKLMLHLLILNSIVYLLLIGKLGIFGFCLFCGFVLRMNAMCLIV